MLWFGFGCLTLLSTIIQSYHGSQFYWWRKPEYPEKTTDLPQGIHWENVKIKKIYHFGGGSFWPLFILKKACMSQLKSVGKMQTRNTIKNLKKMKTINSNLSYVPRIIVLKFQKDRSTRTKVIPRKPFCLQTDDNNSHTQNIQSYNQKITKINKYFSFIQHNYHRIIDISHIITYIIT